MSFGKRTREEVEWNGVGRDVQDIIASRRTSMNPKLKFAIAGSAVAVLGLISIFAVGGDISGISSEAATASHREVAARCLESSKPKVSADTPFANLGGDGDEHMPAYLKCLMNEQPERLCSRSDRSKLARELGIYFRLMKTKQIEFDAHANSETGRKAAARMQQVAAMVGRTVEEAPRPEPHVDVIAGMQGLATSGHLVERDFTPSSYVLVQPYIGELVKAEPGC